MPAKNKNLHGFVPDQSKTALLIIDMISTLEGIDKAAALLKKGLCVADRIVALKQKLRKVGIPTIYANDNFGRWKSDFRTLVKNCRHPEVRGRPLVEKLLPSDEDYFVLKPKHSAFYSTSLDTLLSYLGVQRLILTGMTANQCVLFTANDAHMRDFEIFIPEDCVVSREAAERNAAFFHFEKILRAETCDSRLLLRKLTH